MVWEWQDLRQESLERQKQLKRLVTVLRLSRSLHAQRSLRLWRKAMPVTYKLSLDIELLKHIHVIITSTSWLRPGYLIIAARIVNKFSLALKQDTWTLGKKTTSRSTPDPDLVVVTWEEFPRLWQKKVTIGSHSLPGSSSGSMRGVPSTTINKSH